MKYPKEYLNEIKLRLKVSQVVGKTVQLKKRGKEFIGLSPFKNEKSPSFTVSDEKEFYHCFSTGEHGNIFDFVMKTKSMGFGEAVKVLASEAGMQPYRFSNFDEKKEKKYITYKSILRDYLIFFQKELFKNLDNSLEYLKKRNLDENTIKEFKLGYVPWKNNFYDLLKKKYAEEDINLTGLYYKSDKTGKFIDRFNSRIIFPINNLTGDAIAFGGRIIKESKLAKYINSPETEFYKKGRTVFNLDKVKSLRLETDEVIIVEGYMDVLSLTSSGINNVIANSGTALTDNQIELIWKFFSNPILCLDGDESGQAASMRIAEKIFPLINENNKIFFSIMPGGQDPDDYIKKNGKNSFTELLKNKIIIQDYIWNFYSNKININDPFAVSKFEKEIKKLCYLIKDETLRKYILEDYLEKIKNLTPIQNAKKNFVPGRFFKPNQDFKILNETKKLHKKNDHYTKSEIKELSILFIMLNYPELAKNNSLQLSQTIFSTDKNDNLKNEILALIQDVENSTNIKSLIGEKFNNSIKEINNQSNIKMIVNKKNDEYVEELLQEMLLELKNIKDLKQIESLENKLINNLDENAYSELIRLKSEINRE